MKKFTVIFTSAFQEMDVMFENVEAHNSQAAIERAYCMLAIQSQWTLLSVT